VALALEPWMVTDVALPYYTVRVHGDEVWQANTHLEEKIKRKKDHATPQIMHFDDTSSFTPPSLLNRWPWFSRFAILLPCCLVPGCGAILGARAAPFAQSHRRSRPSLRTGTALRRRCRLPVGHPRPWRQ
jgi:hypothetical protein